MQGKRGERRGEEQEELDARAERDFNERARWLAGCASPRPLPLRLLPSARSHSLALFLSTHSLPDDSCTRSAGLCTQTAAPRSPGLNLWSVSSAAGSPRQQPARPSPQRLTPRHARASGTRLVFHSSFRKPARLRTNERAPYRLALRSPPLVAHT